MSELTTTELEEIDAGYEISEEVIKKILLGIKTSVDHLNQALSGPNSPEIEDINIHISVMFAQTDVVATEDIACWLVDSTKILLRNKQSLKINQK